MTITKEWLLEQAKTILDDPKIGQGIDQFASDVRTYLAKIFAESADQALGHAADICELVATQRPEHAHGAKLCAHMIRDFRDEMRKEHGIGPDVH